MRSFFTAAFLVGMLTSITLAASAEINVREFPVGGSITHVGDSEVHLLSANGTILHITSSSNATSRAPATPRALHRVDGSPTYPGSPMTPPISLLQSSWTVPNLPRHDLGQTIFLVNGLEPASGNAILLTYCASAAGSGTFWSFSTWYQSASTIFFSSFLPVNPSERITSVINLSGTNNAFFNYQAGSFDVGKVQLP
ncbi:hypothetical protein C8J57DRAFT_1503920 [Mycena rebaudengoi]|nr:hypothetical protein C8J57DRAFT_1503920 [Mycena rebaudengoi]